MTNKQDVTSFERTIDDGWENLKVYSLPLHISLFMTLSCFEQIMDATHYAGLQNMRQSLQDLIPMLYKNCKDIGFKASRIKELRESKAPYTYALQAINHAQRYSWTAYHLTCHHRKLCDCEIKERRITFTFTEDSGFYHALADHSFQRQREINNVDQDTLHKLSVEAPAPKVIETLMASVKRSNVNEFIYNIPKDAFETFKTLTQASAPSPSIDENICFSTYTIKQYYEFWITLSALLIGHDFACRTRYERDDNRLLYSKLVFIRPDELANIVAINSGLPQSITSQIIKEHTLSVERKRPDVQIQPFIPLSDEYLLLSPSLFITTHWEVCLFRNWAQISSDRYGETVAPKKAKPLADELTKALTSKNVIIQSGKKLYEKSGKLLTDVDLAIYDKSDGLLVISQIKWVIAPDSFQDSSHAHDELSKGIDQLKQCKIMAEEDLNYFLSSIFEDIELNPIDIKKIRYLLISHGSIDCGMDIKNLNMEVFNYDTCLSIFKSKDISTIEEAINTISMEHDHIINESRRLCSLYAFKISGYLVETQGVSRYDSYKQNGINNQPKNPCPCGSGKRFKDCCKIIEEYEEDKFSAG